MINNLEQVTYKDLSENDKKELKVLQDKITGSVRYTKVFIPPNKILNL